MAMNELLIKRLRTARLDMKMKQQDVADILGIKPNTLSNWEKGRTEPDIDTFVKLCDIYELDCAALLSEVYTFKRIKSDISLAEYEMIKKYRELDEYAKKNVDTILENEYEKLIQHDRAIELGNLTIYDLYADNIEDRDRMIYETCTPKEAAKLIKLLNKRDKRLNATLNAAHERTDIDVPENADTTDNDIMDDENF